MRDSSRSATGQGPSGPLRRVFAQFARPTGLLGHLAGYLMARSEADDQWIVDLLDVQPHDRVLDIGFTEDQVAGIATVLQSVGFRDVTTQQRDLGRERITAVLAGR